MNCEELIWSIVLILMLMFLVAYICSQISRTNCYGDLTSDEGNLDIWKNQIPNNMRRVADTKLCIPKKQRPVADTKLYYDSGNLEKSVNPVDNYITQHFIKKKRELKNFKSYGAYKNATGVRYMKME